MTPIKSDLREPSVHVVLIDNQGIIVGIQVHGRQSGRESNPVLARFAVGESYFNHCDNDDSRADVLALLRLKRTITSFVLSSHSSKTNRIIVVLGVPVSPDAGSGAVLMHIDVTPWTQQNANEAWSMPAAFNPAMIQDTISNAFVRQFAEAQHSYQAPPSHPDIESLSPRQREVLLLVAAGKSNLEISEELSCSLNTVKRHVTAVLQKLHLPNRTRAANLANQLNLLPPAGRRR